MAVMETSAAAISGTILGYDAGQTSLLDLASASSINTTDNEAAQVAAQGG